MKILVTGANGQIGYDVLLELDKRGYKAVGTGTTPRFNGIMSKGSELPYIQLDITNREEVDKTIQKVKPDAIIHCAAWTLVDEAEDEINQDSVYNVNVKGTEYLALAAKKIGSKFLYISTDYVFGGDGDKPWPSDFTNYKPLNYYGETKLLGEKIVFENSEKYFIVRVAWVFGLNGENFVKTIIRAGKKYNKLTVVNDQIGRPTYSYHLSKILVDMIESNKYGYYNVTNEGDYISWYEFTKEIFKLLDIQTRVLPVTTKEYGVTKAKRPFNSRLSTEKLSENGFKMLPSWNEALKHFVEVSNFKGED